MSESPMFKNKRELLRQAHNITDALDALHVQAANLKTMMKAVKVDIDAADETDIERMTQAISHIVEYKRLLDYSLAHLVDTASETASESPVKAIDNALEKIDPDGGTITVDANAFVNLLQATRNLITNKDGYTSVHWRDDKTPVLCVPCKYGTLFAEFTGDPGIYDGIGVDLQRFDGTCTQLATIETKPDGTLHALIWNGDDEDYDSEIRIKPNGNFTYSDSPYV